MPDADVPPGTPESEIWAHNRHTVYHRSRPRRVEALLAPAVRPATTRPSRPVRSSPSPRTYTRTTSICSPASSGPTSSTRRSRSTCCSARGTAADALRDRRRARRASRRRVRCRCLGAREPRRPPRAEPVAGAADATDPASWTGSNMLLPRRADRPPARRAPRRAALGLVLALPGSVFLYVRARSSVSPRCSTCPMTSRQDPRSSAAVNWAGTAAACRCRGPPRRDGAHGFSSAWADVVLRGCRSRPSWGALAVDAQQRRFPIDVGVDATLLARSPSRRR